MKGAVMRPARTSLSLMYLQCCRLAIICLTCVKTANTTVYMGNHCHKSISNKGDLIKSQDTLYYKPNSMCEAVINVDAHSRILLQISDMNFVSDFECTHSYLEVFPVAKHSSEDPDTVRMCNITQVPRHILSQGSYLRLRLVNNGADVGRGFSGVFSTLYPTGKPLSCREHDYYHCSNGFCISSDLTCDTINHCGDNSDERSDFCKEPEMNWMDVKKGPISIVEMAFTLIGLIIIGVVVTVVITNCCKDLHRRRKIKQIDYLPAEWKRTDSFSAQPPGHRVPIQRTRSTSLECSARNAAQEDLRYLRQISSSLNWDDVFEETEGLASPGSPKRKLSIKSADNIKKIENNFHELHKNDREQPDTNQSGRRRRLSSYKSVTFIVGDSDTDTPDESKNAAEQTNGRRVKNARRGASINNDETTKSKDVPAYTKERRKMFAAQKSTGFTIQEEHGEGNGHGAVERGNASELLHRRQQGKVGLPRRSSHKAWYDLDENNVCINSEREKLLSTTDSEGSMEAKFVSGNGDTGTGQDENETRVKEPPSDELGNVNSERELLLRRGSESHAQNGISDQNANSIGEAHNEILVGEELCGAEMDSFVLETEI